MSTNSTVVSYLDVGVLTHSGVFARSPRTVPFAVSPDAHAVASLRIGERVLRGVTWRGGVDCSLTLRSPCCCRRLANGFFPFCGLLSHFACCTGCDCKKPLDSIGVVLHPAKWSGWSVFYRFNHRSRCSTTVVETPNDESSGAPLLHFFFFLTVANTVPIASLPLLSMGRIPSRWDELKPCPFASVYPLRGSCARFRTAATISSLLL